MRDVCQGCKQFAEIVTTDHLGIQYCAKCATDTPVSSSEWAGIDFLLANPPFHSGDRVECRTGGEIFEGTGIVQEMSYDWAHGGTVIYPAFRVTIDEPANEYSPAEGWWTEPCLQRVGDPK